MSPIVFQKIVFFGILLFMASSGVINAQETQKLQIDVTAERHPQKENLLDVMVKIANTDTASFNGYLKVIAPAGFTSILGDSIAVHVGPNGKHFVPLKVKLANNAAAGNAHFDLQFFSDAHKLQLKHPVTYNIPADVRLRLFAAAPILYLRNPQDSVQVSVTVSNQGNVSQPVAIVFNIPELSGEKKFFEQTGFSSSQRDTVFRFRFRPSEKLLQLDQFTVHIAGLRGDEKELFGNTTVSILNLSSVRRYNNFQPTDANFYYGNNSLTASYRNMGNNVNIYQLIGNTSIDLPAGFLNVNGNVYTFTNDYVPIVTNTYLSYHLNESHVQIGNLSQPLEVPLFGRGGEVALNSKSKNYGIRAGFIDENFNLIEKNSFLKHGYGFYAIGALNRQNTLNNYTANYIFKEDEMENARHQVLGAEVNRNLGKPGTVKINYYQGYSDYYTKDIQKSSFAVEAQHSGDYKSLKLSGNYYYSSKYFPGNRRGLLQIQQTLIKMLGSGSSLYANVFLSDFAPKSYTYNIDIRSNNIRTDLGFNLPRLRMVHLNFSYQYQQEFSNSLNKQLNIADTGNTLKLDAHRLISNLNWTTANQKHSFILSLENGIARYPLNDQFKLQSKLNGTYVYKAFNVNATYQYGSYFLSEYAAARRLGNNEIYKRLMLTMSVNQPLFDKKLLISSGASYINDYMTGKTPSAFLNVKYAPTTPYFVFVNASWFRYDFGRISALARPVSVTSIEVGITYNFRKPKASSGRKGKLTAQVYYDNNTNNILDKGDSLAGNRLIVLNNTSFQTDTEGKISYKSVPFGKYKLQPSAQQGWFSVSQDIVLDKYHTSIQVPLHQSGTVSGAVTYDVDTRTSVHFQPRYNGIAFNIYNSQGAILQKIITDEAGNFMSFLPTGNYQLSLVENTLPDNTFIEKNTTVSFTVNSGTITNIPEFIIKAKEKKKVVKKFGQ